MARFTDSHSISLAGRSITAAKWLVATGSPPAVPALEGLSEAGYLTNREICSLQTLAEINKRVVGNIFAPKFFSKTVRKDLKLIQRYQDPGVEPA
jgi:hypothetical protein